MEGIGAALRFRIAKMVSSDIQDGHHDSHLENLQITSALEHCLIELKLDGRHWGVMEIQNC